IAVVGLSNNPARPSYGVTRYMQAQGYTIVPINPELTELFGEKAYPDLLSVPFPIDLVDVFRRSELVGPHVDEAIQKGVKTVWMQLGVRNEQAAQRARDAGIEVVMDRCILVEHRRLLGG
ncbi:MAG: CoA-binding protein, partial [Chloroflexi bacterium]|nr:CoA-binding protein [Chloroflexota bacterium]